ICGASFREPNVCGLDVLIAKTLDYVLSLLLVEFDLCGSHDLARSFAFGIQVELNEAGRIVRASSIVIQLTERHEACRDNGDCSDSISRAFPRHSDLISG